MRGFDSAAVTEPWIFDKQTLQIHFLADYWSKDFVCFNIDELDLWSSFIHYNEQKNKTKTINIISNVNTIGCYVQSTGDSAVKKNQHEHI